MTKTISPTAPATDPVFDVESWAARTAPEGYRFDEAAAAKAAAFFPRYLRHSKGRWAGQPFELRPDQAALVRTIFGWKRPDGTRRFRIVYKTVPRKNGKTTFAAGIALYLTFSDNEAGAEVYSFANDTDQAAICFNEAARMRSRSPVLSKYSVAYKRSMVVPRAHASYKVLSSSTGNKDGLNASGIIGDELHAVRDRLLYEVVHTSTGSRAQPLELLITTAGFDRDSLCWELQEYAERVRDGQIEDSEFLPVIYAAAPEDDWTDPAVWAKANPGLGQTISYDYIEKQVKRAKDLPRYENTFKRLHLNIWTEQSVRWLPMADWDACAAPRRDLADFAGRACWGGLDLSATTDVSALSLVFPDEDEPGWFDVFMKFWLPGKDLADRSKRDRQDYEQWARDGWLTCTEGDVIDYDVIRATITGVGPAGEALDNAPITETVDLRELAIDRWNATQITTQLAGDGVVVVPFGQGYASMSAPAKMLEQLVVGRKLRHGGDPVLRAHAANAVVQTDAAENIKPTKDPKKSSGRIDGIVALTMALGRATVAEAPKTSYTLTHGVVAL